MKKRTGWRICWGAVLALAGIQGALGAKIYPDDCPGMTLQQCVDSDNGGTGPFFITVRAGTYTNQNVAAIFRSGHIVAESGLLNRPQFVDSQWQWDTVGTDGSGVRGIKFTGDSWVQIWLTGALGSGETVTVYIDDNEFDINTGSGATTRGIVSLLESGFTGPADAYAQVRMTGNTVRLQAGAEPASPLGLFHIDSINTTVQTDISIHGNTLQTNRRDNPGVLVKRSRGNLDIIMAQNEVRGAQGVRFEEATTTNTGNLRFYAFYNLFSDRYANGVRPHSFSRLVESTLDATSTPGDVSINFHHNTFDGGWDILRFIGHTTTAANNSLNLYDNIFTGIPGTFLLYGGLGSATLGNGGNIIGPSVIPGSSYTPAANDQVGVDPLYVAAPARYALKAGSPAIDASGNADLGLGLAQLVLFGIPVPGFLAIPHVDADGFRRVIDGDDSASAEADTGAYEWGDSFIVHETSDNNQDPANSNVSQIYDSAINADADASGFFSHLWSYEDTPGQFHDEAIGWWRTAAGRWSLYKENWSTPMPSGLVYSVFYPTGDRAGSGNSDFRGIKEVQVGGAPVASLDTGLTERGLAVFVRHVYRTGAAVYDPVNLEVFYDGSSWRIYHVDGSDLPANAAYMVYYQQPSQNVFLVTPGGNSPLFGGSVVVGHSLLVFNCTTPVVQQVALSGFFGNGLGGNPANQVLDVAFSAGVLGITNEDGSVIPTWNILGGGTGFFVMVDPKQTFECQDRIYKDDFDH